MAQTATSRPLPAAVLLAGCLLSVSVDGLAQSTEVCKWVDDQGTVHYDTECPEGVDSSTVTVDTRSPEVADDPFAESRQQDAATPTRNNPLPVPPPPTRTPDRDLSRMSAQELRTACEQARERLLKPVRDSLIEKCKSQGDKDPDYCERFYADYGSGGMRGGRRIQPLFADLPECVAAREARD